MRYHNRIAERLAQANFISWSSDQLFEETRKIVTAILQHVTYNEYLPLVIGKKNMIKYELFSAETGFDTVYNKMVDATVKNSLGAAAFRFGHSQITNFQSRMNSQYHRYSETPIEQTFNRPRMCTAQHGENIPDLLRWLFTDKSAEADRYYYLSTYSETCFRRPPKGKQKSSLLRQVVFWYKLNELQRDQHLLVL